MMKKLTNVSPFLLLLFPVFMVMLMAFATGISKDEQSEALTTKTSTSTTIAKVATSILK